MAVVGQTADNGRGLLDAFILNELLDQGPAWVLAFRGREHFFFGAAFDRQEHAALDVHQRRGHDEEVARQFKVVLLLCPEDLEVLLRDLLDRDIIDIDLVLADQEKEEVERTLEDIQADGQVRRWQDAVGGDGGGGCGLVRHGSELEQSRPQVEAQCTVPEGGNLLLEAVFHFP